MLTSKCKVKSFVNSSVTKDFGIEVELENLDFGDFVEKNIQGWKITFEDSLRDGLEYVSYPTNISDLSKLMKSFDNSLNGYKPEVSSRTGLHIHFNVLDCTQEEILKIVLLYSYFEKYLISANNPYRKGNLFCLSMEDAEYMYYSIMDNIDKNRWFKFFDTGKFKYAACNLATVSTLGTLEFRFMDSTYNSEDIKNWVMILNTIIKYAKSNTFEHIDEIGDNIPKLGFILNDYNKFLVRKGGNMETIGASMLAKRLSSFYLSHKEKPSSNKYFFTDYCE